MHLSCYKMHTKGTKDYHSSYNGKTVEHFLTVQEHCVLLLLRLLCFVFYMQI